MDKLKKFIRRFHKRYLVSFLIENGHNTPILSKRKSLMKSIVVQLLMDALDTLKANSLVPREIDVKVSVERSKDSKHGDFSTNLALILAKPCQKAPKVIAEALINALKSHADVERVEMVMPGFINFFISHKATYQIIQTVLEQGDHFGRSQIGQDHKVILEFVSANPNGPLHVGHGRGAAFGASLGNVLAFAGFKVSREYYVNDAGRQMAILAVSVWLRYLSLAGQSLPFPVNAYKGDYVIDMAKTIFNEQGVAYNHNWETISQGLPKDEIEGGDKEIYIDALIMRAKNLLGEQAFHFFLNSALKAVLADIKDDLAQFGVHFDQWFSEKSLMDSGDIAKGIKALEKAGYTYTKEGALWFKSTDFGDEKDRVLIRANGVGTYFASDVAYHWNKYDRGFDKVIDIFGSDHHGYMMRVKSAVKALGHDEQALKMILVQFATLYRDGERVQMSTRSGSFVTLRQLREEVGKDAARFFYVMRKPDQHMDFDLSLAKSQSSDNPVYYVQYAHARISSVLRQVQERGLVFDQTMGCAHLALLTQPHEQNLMTLIAKYPDIINTAATLCEPHQIAYYLRELATGLHSYYNAIIIICDQEELRHARLCLLKAVREVLRSGLNLLDVSAPESM